MPTRERSSIRVDYTQSHWIVYRGFVKLLIEADAPQKLDFLTQVKFDSSSEERHSWLLDFSSQEGFGSYSGISLFSAGRFQTCEMTRWSMDGEILMLQGVLLDTVDRVYSMNVEFHQ